MRKLALAHLTIEEATPESVVAAAADAGFAAVGLRITGFTPQTDHVGLVDNPSAVQALRRQLDDRGVRIVNICSFRLTDQSRLSDYLTVIETCVALGADTMLATCFIADHARRVALVAAIADEAGKSGLRIGLEFFKSSQLKSLHAAEQLRGDTGHGNVGHIIDALHYFRGGHAPTDLSAIAPDTIYGFQLCDGLVAPATDDGLRDEIRNRLLPGQGSLPLLSLIEAVPRDLLFEIEAPSPALAELPLFERARRAKAAGDAMLTACGET